MGEVKLQHVLGEHNSSHDKHLLSTKHLYLIMEKKNPMESVVEFTASMFFKDILRSSQSIVPLRTQKNMFSGFSMGNC